MVQAGLKVVKCLMFAFNFLFVVCGIALIAIGSWVLAANSQYHRLLDGATFAAAPILLIVAGVVVVLVSFLGCCGAIRENRCMLITFGIFLILISILEIAAGVTGYVYRGTIDTHLSDTTTKLVKAYGLQDEGVTSFIDFLQHDLKCCGAETYMDWANTEWQKGHLSSVPDSCCIEDQPQCGVGQIVNPFNKIYTKGCYPAFKDVFESKILIVAGVGIGIGLVELLGIIFAFCLASAIKRKHEVV